MDGLIDWVQANEALVGWLGTISLLTFLGSLIVVPIIVARMPADYFIDPEPDPGSYRAEHPVIRLTTLVLKNFFGTLFVLAGIAMLVLPGQGIVTILIGLSLMNFPHKRDLELWIVRRRSVLRAVNWIRHRAGRPALVLPAE